MASSTPKLRLVNKVVIVTGGARGIGECIARTFVEHGAKVVITDVRDDLGELVCKDLGPESAHFVHCDVAIESDIENVVNTTIARHGKLDIMINNAGISDTPKLSILDNEKSDYELVISVNLTSFLGNQTCSTCDDSKLQRKHHNDCKCCFYRWWWIISCILKLKTWCGRTSKEGGCRAWEVSNSRQMHITLCYTN